MITLGADPESIEPDRSTTKRNRPKRNYRDTPNSLATYFDDHVKRRRMARSRLSDVNYPALRGLFKDLLEETDADHIRRMIRQFAEDIDGPQPIRSDKPAWIVFKGRRAKLFDQTVNRRPSEIDYDDHYKKDPAIERMKQKKGR